MFSRRVFILLILAFINLGINAQQVYPHSTLLDFNVPSPNAASLGKFGDIPVNYSVGIPSISIPIYNYTEKSNSLALNISLDYHAGGIRVGDKSSNVGTGWALNAGGVITRQMRGGPDEGGMGYTGYWSAPALPNITDYQNNENMYGTTINPVNPYYRYNTGLEDSEPDVFSFNFEGKAGKFIIGKNGDVLVYPRQQLKITKTSNTPTYGFTVVTQDGVKYVFDQMEKSSSYNGAIKYFTPSAWYLSKIVAPFSAEEITFTYESYTSSYQRLFSQTAYKSLSIQHAGLAGMQSYANYMSFEAKRLTNITLPRGTSVNFTYSSEERCDLPGDKALKEITITDGLNSKGFRLSSNYSFSSATPAPATCSGLNETDTRLVLHSVTEYSGTTEKAPYKVEYNTSASLPGVNSYAVDHWGFFNGAFGNSSLIPYNGTGTGIPPSGTIDNANRESNANFAQAGTITKLFFPTGGYSEFLFESNTAPAEGGSSTVNVYKTATINGMLTEKSTTFTLEKPGVSTSATTFHFEFGGFSPANSGCRVIASITSLDGATTYESVTLGPGVGHSKNVVVNIPPGTYKYKYVFETGSPCVSELFVVALDWVNIVTVPAGTGVVVGGLRIKEINEYDGVVSGAVKSRKYSYELENSAVSSGVLAIKPSYYYYYNDYCTGGFFCMPGDEAACAAQTASYIVLYSSPLFTLSNALGNTVLYSRVVEQFAGNGTGNNGKTVRLFTTSSTMPDNGFPYDAFNPSMMSAPYVTPQTLHWIYGSLLSEQVFDNTNQLKRSIENTYSLKADALPANVKENFKGIKVYKRNSTWAGCRGDQLQYVHYLLNDYFPITGTAQLVSSVVKEYGTNGVVNTKWTAKEYDPVYYDVVKTTTHDSKGTIYDERFYYPYSYSGNLTFTEMLNTHHILSPIIGKELWQERPGVSGSRKLIGGQVVEYAKFNNTIIRPSIIYDLVTAAPIPEATIGVFNPAVLVRNSTYYKPEIQFLSYDSRANVTEQKKVWEDIPLAYLWDSKKVSPVAQVSQAKVNEIFYDGFEEGNGWEGTWVNFDNTKSHTGRSSGRIDNGTSNEMIVHSTKWLDISLNADKEFTYSGWVYSDGPTVEIYLFMKTAAETGYFTHVDVIGTNVTGKWVYINGKYTVPANITKLNLRIDNNGGGSVWYDDMRLHPSTARMETLTYQPLAGITSKSDVNSQPLYFEYDALQRLTTQRDKNRNILKAFCYNYNGQTENCSSLVEFWQPTGLTRCQRCPGNISYTTNIQERQEKQTNPNLANYGSFRWVSEGTSANCLIVADWQNTASPIRCVQVNGVNTGDREREQRDMNPCSYTYNQTRWVYYDTNPTACPTSTCNSSNCVGNDKKCINGNCVTGTAICVSAVRSGRAWTSTWRYCFPDGTMSTYSWTELSPLEPLTISCEP